MHPIVGLLLLALVVGLAIAIGKAVAMGRRAAWVEAAQRLGLVHNPGDAFTSQSLSGSYQGVAVHLTTDSSGSGSDHKEWTIVTAAFRMPAPTGLRVTRAGLGTDFAKLFGGQDIEVGLPEADDPLRIQGDSPEAVRAWFQKPGVGDAVLGFLMANETATVQDGCLRVTLDGFVTDVAALEAALQGVTGAVRQVEGGSHWDPAAEEPFQVLPRLPAPSPGAGPGPAPTSEPDPPPGDAPPSAADALVASLAASGEADSSGTFTLDREVARERMREFQLAEPERYVVSLFQAAVCKGARVIDVTVDHDDVILRFDGDALTAEDFEHLYAALFAASSDRALRARQRLALGLSAALGLGPRYVEVRSGDGRTGAELRLAPGEPDRYGPLAEEVPDRTTIHVKLGLGRSLGGLNARVEAALRRAGRYARVGLDVNGEPVSRGLDPGGILGGVALAWEGYAGVCGFDRELGEGAELRLIVDGAWVATEALDGAVPGLFCVVEAEGLRQDLSGGAIVQDRVWQGAREAAAEAEPRALTALAEPFVSGHAPRGFPGPWAGATLRAALRRYYLQSDFAEGGPARALAEVPLWPTTSGGAISLAALLEARRRDGKVTYTDFSLAEIRRFGRAAPRLGFDPERAVDVASLAPQDRALLVHLLGGALRCGTPELLGEAAGSA